MSPPKKEYIYGHLWVLGVIVVITAAFFSLFQKGIPSFKAPTHAITGSMVLEPVTAILDASLSLLILAVLLGGIVSHNLYSKVFMARRNLQDYIGFAMHHKVKPEKIVNTLKDNGWEEAEIRKAIRNLTYWR
jgi:hypothetical protein